MTDTAKVPLHIFLPRVHLKGYEDKEGNMKTERQQQARRLSIARPSLDFSVGWKFYLALLAAGIT